MPNLYCDCGYMFGKNMDLRYGEMKCPKCKRIVVIDRYSLTGKREWGSNKIRNK